MSKILLIVMLVGSVSDIPRGRIDGLANIALAPELCRMDTDRMWTRLMQVTAKEFDVPLVWLEEKVSQARDYWRDGYVLHPDTVQQMCKTLKMFMSGHGLDGTR